MKVRLAYLYGDGDDEPIVLLDEGQDFPKLYAEFNAQDDAMCNELDSNGPAHSQWRGFNEFMGDKGVKFIHSTTDEIYRR